VGAMLLEERSEEGSDAARGGADDVEGALKRLLALVMSVMPPTWAEAKNLRKMPSTMTRVTRS